MTAIDILIIAIFGALAVASIHWARFAYNDRFAPLGLYLGVTFSTLALWHTKLVSLIQISTLAYFIILLSVVGFIFGAFIAGPGKQLCTSESVDINRSIVKGKHLRSFFYVIGILSTIGWILLLTMFASEYSLETVWEKPYLLQSGFQSRRYIGYLNLLGILVLPTYVLLTRTKRGAGWLSIVLVVSALTGLLLAGIKSYLVFSAVTTFLVWGNFRRAGAPLRYIVILAISFIIYMSIYDQIIDVFIQKTGAESVLSSIAPGLSRPYIYMVGSWSSLSVLADNPIPQPVWGYHSLLFVWKVLGSGLGLIESVPETAKFMDIADIGTQQFNVYSMAGGLYWDYKLIGVLLGTAFWGFVSTSIYRKARKSRDWAWILGSSIINYGLFISFFLYYFTFNLLFLLAVVLVAVALRSVVSGYFDLGFSTKSGGAAISPV